MKTKFEQGIVSGQVVSKLCRVCTKPVVVLCIEL